MKEWMLPTLAAVFCWGSWAFLPKFSAQYISTKNAIIYQALGGVIVAFFIFLSLSDRLEIHPKGSLLAIFAGMLNFLGVLFYIKAVSKGPVGIVSTLSALYPLVVIALGWIVFDETLTLKQLIGIGFAVMAIALIAT